MPRAMPPYTKGFAGHVSDAILLAVEAEYASTALGRSRWPVARIELLYELAYLRLFIQWELLLEQSFLRYLCGYSSAHGTFAPVTLPGPSTLAAARLLVFGGRDFLLWHDASRVVARAQRYLMACPHETVLASHAARLAQFSAVRHRIAHDHDDARLKFNAATMLIAGRRYRVARPGRFLRDWDRSVAPPRRWLETLATELANLAAQIA